MTLTTLNRTAILVKARQPFLDWLHWVDETSTDITLEDVRHDPSVYLIPECDSDDQVRERLARVCVTVFEEQLSGWYNDEATWPNHRDWATFENWFEWTSHSMVIDLCAGRLKRETL